MTKVKVPLLNILIGLLIIAAIATLYIPTCAVGEKTISVMGYLSFPTEHKDVTAIFQELYEDFNLNLEVWGLLLLQILGVCSLVLMALYPAQKKSMTLPILFAVEGIGCLCVNRLVYVGGFTFIDIALMAVVLLVALYNVGFVDWLLAAVKRPRSAKE